MMFFYSAQIHLRKVLNRVHTDLYKVESTYITKIMPCMIPCINADKRFQNKGKLAGRLMCRKS